MRAVAIESLGDAEQLHLTDMPQPVPRENEVRVRLDFAAVNPVDYKLRSGEVSYFDLKFPFILGFDGAGEIDEVGTGVDKFSPGDRVVLMSNQLFGKAGTYAESVVSSARWTVKLPYHVSTREAATLPTAGMAAWEAVIEAGKASEGMNVLVNGGAGGVGSFAIQLAKMAGAKVAATCSRENFDYVLSLGAELAIDYREMQVARDVRNWSPEGVCLMIDTIGNGSLPEPVGIVRPRGMVSAIGVIAEDFQPEAVSRATEAGISIVAAQTHPDRWQHQLSALVEAIAAGSIRSPETYAFDLGETAHAHCRIEAGHVRGKLLLNVRN